MDYEYEPTVDQPSHEDMEALLFEAKEMVAIDGCVVWFGQRCPHGLPGWDLYLGYDPENYGIVTVCL